MTRSNTPRSDESKPDLTLCDREPIHLLGAVQPHGCLIAVSRDGRVVAHSENVSPWFGVDTVRLGAAVDEVLDPGLATLIRSFENRGDLFQTEMHRARTELGEVPVHLHVSDQGVCIAEFWRPVASMDQGELSRFHSMNNELLAMGQSGGDRADVARQTCEVIRRTTGFDRVVLYRFRSDESGEVIGEDKREDKESWVGLRYPASDIPKQARALLVRNRIRLIEDIAYLPVPIAVDDEVLGGPIDLSDAALRSVSMVHREYFANMGVRASVALSIVVEGRLWGVIACHHDEPKSLPVEAWPMMHLLAQCWRH